MELAALSVALLEAPADAPVLDEGKADALQDARLDFLASLHERGVLLVAGPFISPPGREFRGMCLLRLPLDTVLELFGKDPLVQAGSLRVRVLDWAVPAGAMSFSPTKFPHSQAEL
jgi:uncharacterized protein YciI